MTYNYSGFGLTPEQQNAKKIADMREKAMEAEMRRYFRLEAREEFKDMLRQAAIEAGTSVEEILEEPKPKPTGAEIAAGVVMFAFDLPRIIVALALYGTVLWLFGMLIYYLWFK